MDLVTGAVVIVGLQKVVGPTAQMLSGVVGRILGQPADALGEVAAHPIREWQRQRVRRAEQVVLDAATLIAEQKGIAKPVPGRLLFPILEHSSVEEDRDLRRVWSRLLASAAMPDPKEPVLAAYPHILAELTPLEVKILDYVFGSCEERLKIDDGEPIDACVFRKAAVRKRFRIHAGLAMTIRDNLTRLNLIEAVISPPDNADTTSAMWPSFVTNLGHDFYRACQGPGPGLRDS